MSNFQTMQRGLFWYSNLVVAGGDSNDRDLLHATL